MKAENFGKKLGAHKVYLKTGKGWEAEKFYQKLGYKNVAILRKHHLKKDFVVYEKEIQILLVKVVFEDFSLWFLFLWFENRKLSC